MSVLSESGVIVRESIGNPAPEAMCAVVQRVGVAANRTFGYTAIFHRVLVKLSTKYRVWPVVGDKRYLELDPSEWREKYRVIEEHKTDAPAQPT